MKKIIISNKKKFAVFAALILILSSGSIFLGYKFLKWPKAVPEIEELSIQKASEMGEKKTVQLLVQIFDTGGTPGTLQRGDVLFTAPEDKQFSIAEQEGFLILKMRLTQQQQQLLELSLKEKPGIFADEQERENRQEIQRRKFAVDLARIGIGPEQKMGKVISDKVFEDEVLIQKQ